MPLFTNVKDTNKTANAINNGLSLISNYAFNWKLLFNMDPSKPAQEALFLRKKKLQTHPIISLNIIQVQIALCQKYFGVFLDEKLNCKQHVDNAIMKVNKGISVIYKMWYKLPRGSLFTIYKAFW